MIAFILIPPIKVFHLKEEQEAKLKELQFLSGLENENYEECKCYSSIISNTTSLDIISS